MRASTRVAGRIRRVRNGKQLLTVAASLLVLAVVVLFGRAIFLGQTFAERDLGAFRIPLLGCCVSAPCAPSTPLHGADVRGQ